MVSRRPSRDEVLLRTAELWALRSTCNKPNGAVIAKEGKIISVGYNGSPPGHPHCIDEGCLEGQDGGCIRTIHSESNAIAMAAKFGISTSDGTMYCTSSPCPICSKLIIVAGIKFVYFRNLYRDPSGLDLLAKSGIQAVQVINDEMKRCMGNYEL